MKKWMLCVAVIALLLAPSALALYPCEDCSYPNGTRCAGICPGVPVLTTCAVWLDNNCPVYFAPADISDKDLFLLSLEAQSEAESSATEDLPTLPKLSR